MRGIRDVCRVRWPIRKRLFEEDFNGDLNGLNRETQGNMYFKHIHTHIHIHRWDYKLKIITSSIWVFFIKSLFLPLGGMLNASAVS